MNIRNPNEMERFLQTLNIPKSSRAPFRKTLPPEQTKEIIEIDWKPIAWLAGMWVGGLGFMMTIAALMQ